MKNLFFLIICCLALVQLSCGQDTRPKITDAESQELLKIIKDEHLMRNSLAYQSTAVQRMLEEANYCAVQLKLPVPHPLKISDISEIYVTSLWGSKIEDTNLVSIIERVRRAKYAVGGSIWMTNFCFFFNTGRLWSIANRTQHMERFDLYPLWARTPSIIVSNEAVQIATQWLAWIDVDVDTLSKKYPAKIEQQWFWNQPGLNVHHLPGDTNKTMLPIFNVTWGNDAAQVRVLGTTKELMELRVGDAGLSSRPLLIITNAIELNNIPDPQIKKLERQLPSKTTNTAPATSPISERETKP